MTTKLKDILVMLGYVSVAAIIGVELAMLYMIATTGEMR